MPPGITVRGRNSLREFLITEAKQLALLRTAVDEPLQAGQLRKVCAIKSFLASVYFKLMKPLGNKIT